MNSVPAPGEWLSDSVINQTISEDPDGAGSGSISLVPHGLSSISAASFRLSPQWAVAAGCGLPYIPNACGQRLYLSSKHLHF